MKTGIIILCIAAGSLTASGQFFSEDEKAAKKGEEEQLLSSLPEEAQKQVYMQYCAAKETALQKAAGMYPVRIHHTPEQRETQQHKAELTQKRLLDHYKTDIAEANKIAPDYLEKIITAGKEKRWPEAPPPVEEE